MGDLSKNFNRSEFSCKCGCGYNNVSMLLVKNLQMLRDITQKAIQIESGCRCEKHNLETGGEHNSAHLRGEAADIIILNSRARFNFVMMAFHFFRRVGIGKNFVHIDVARDLPRDVMWTYYK